jgi:preprotein translocase subunit Sec63
MREDPLSRLSERWLRDLEGETANWLQDILRGIFDPAAVMAFAKSLGIDVSKLADSATGTTGFDAYAVLGLDRSASNEMIKKRYREMMAKIHPDKAGEEMTFLASLVNAAYQHICRERGI